jgi:hypothetical protein
LPCSLDRGDDIAATALHVGGWSVGDTAFHGVDRGGNIHVVTCSNGENQIRAEDDDVSRGVATGMRMGIESAAISHRGFSSV